MDSNSNDTAGSHPTDAETSQSHGDRNRAIISPPDCSTRFIYQILPEAKINLKIVAHF